MFKGCCSDHHVCQGECPAFTCQRTLERPGPACDGTGNRVTFQAGKKSLCPQFFSRPHAGIDLANVDGGSCKQVSAGDQFGQQRPPVLTRTQHVEQYGGVQQQNHWVFLAGRLALGMRFSLSDRILRTHATGPASSSAWSFSPQAAFSSRKNSSTLRRQSSAAPPPPKHPLRPPR